MAASLAACQPRESSAPATPERAAAKPDGWDALVTAARGEGTAVIYGAATTEALQVFAEDFARAYPDIKVEFTFAIGSDLVSRIVAERQAGRYIPDLLISGSTYLGTLKPMGALAPLRPTFVLAEVADPSGWLQGKLWWADEAEPYTTLHFQGLQAAAVFVNPTLVSPTEFSSYWDLLNPRWKGKIASGEIRYSSGPGGVPARVIYKNPQLGAEWFERLYGEMDVTLSRDQRQLVDWLVQGRFPILLFASNSEYAIAKDQGLPIAMVPLERFKEGGALGPGGGALSLVERAPHPNASKVLINWLLSREGQQAWQRHTRLPSLRIDIPKDGLIEDYVPRSGYTYVNGGTEEYDRITPEVFNEIITRALERAGRG